MSYFVHTAGGAGARRKPLNCCVCGAFAGRWLQHSNRDTGWGLCASCRDRLPASKPAEYTPEEMARLYGLPGRNYEGKLHRLHGRLFVVVAEFPESDEDRANAFMEQHEGASVLEVVDGRVVLAWKQDSGIEAPASEGAAA